MSSLSDYVDALLDLADGADVEASAAVTDDASLEVIVDAAARLDVAAGTLREASKRLSVAAAERMERDHDRVGNYRLSRGRSSSTKWDAPLARSAVVEAIVRRLAVNPETGEVIQPLRMAVEQAVNMTYSVTSTANSASMTVAGLKALGLDPNRYRSTEDRGWRLRIEPIPQGETTS